MNFHFAETAVKLLTNPVLDPIGKIPEYKVCAVKLEAA
jgi:predicted molibdopterin-dependent oxidoreductase YjgC